MSQLGADAVAMGVTIGGARQTEALTTRGEFVREAIAMLGERRLMDKLSVAVIGCGKAGLAQLHWFADPSSMPDRRCV